MIRRDKIKIKTVLLTGPEGYMACLGVHTQRSGSERDGERERDTHGPMPLLGQGDYSNRFAMETSKRWV